MLFLLNRLQPTGTVGQGLFFALFDLVGLGLLGQMQLAQAGLLLGLEQGHFFSRLLGFGGFLLFLPLALGRRRFAHPRAPRQLVKLPANRRLLRDLLHFALLGGAEKALAAGF